MGCAVTAISSGEGKREDAFALGSDEFRDSKKISHAFTEGAAEGREDAQPANINVLLITSNAVPKLETVLPLLARRATIVLMTIQMEPLEVPYMQFVLPGHRLIASTEASRENHIKMPEFAERKQIKPWTEVFEITAGGVAKAFERLEKGEMRCRGVLARSQA
ncbi:Putative NAD(P)-binding domain superfamily [Septoria linicola]|uniref:NAD(P)-binding domain superfamily n=1 Tax=Septoria linicola TaxID=215465 RepID=A0A9Q9AK29_9PEZI|nr:putative NAD(P)-binding domain superfamily [Septoria linicola]USW50779.1 Putative NAD(P)-binding domain superfamily [Septoria linicola]